eukprot:3067520-Heterocapsa_arctica.AAC.1
MPQLTHLLPTRNSLLRKLDAVRQRGRLPDVSNLAVVCRAPFAIRRARRDAPIQSQRGIVNGHYV